MNTKNFNTTDYIISHFVANDECRPVLNKAYQQNGFVYASNSHIVIKVPKELCAKEYDEVTINEKKIPNFEKFMNEVEMTLISEININQILPCIENIKIKLAGYETDCEKCDGEGEIECKCCGNTSDCEECKGTGKIKHKGKIMIRDVWFEKDNETIRAIEIENKKYNPVYLELVMFSMLAKGFDTCEYYLHTTSENFHRGVFKFGGIEILIIGVFGN